MKRILPILSALLFTVAMTVPVRAHADEEVSVQIQIGTISAEASDQIDLPVEISQCKGVDSVQFDINYDSTALEFIFMTPGDLFAAQYTVVNADILGRIRVACAGALGLESAGTLMTLRFQILTETGSAVTVSSGIVTRIDADYNQTKALVAIEDGGVTVGDAP